MAAMLRLLREDADPADRAPPRPGSRWRRSACVAGAAVVLYTAEAGTAVGAAGPQGPSIESLAAAGGGTDVFRTLAAFTATFLFVVFVGAVAAEFPRARSARSWSASQAGPGSWRASSVGC